MLIYYCIWFLLFILSYCEIISFKDISLKKNLKLNIIFILVITFVSLAGLKGNVGTDYLSYQTIYQDVSESTFYSPLQTIEPGFWYWMKIVSLFGGSFVFFWFITCLINISLKFYIFSKISPYLSVSLAIYLVGLFFERDFDGIRQGLAISFSYLGIYFLLMNKIKSYYCFLAIAISIHYTSLLFLFTPYLIKLELSKKIIYISLGIAFICAILKLYILSEQTLSIFGYNFLTARVLNYIENEKYGTTTGISIGIIFRIILLILFVGLRPYIKIKPKIYNLLKNGLFFAIISSLLFNNIEILSHRFAYGFREFQIIIFAYLITAFKKQSDRIIISTIILLYSFILLYRLLHTPHLAPFYIYESIFSI